MGPNEAARIVEGKLDLLKRIPVGNPPDTLFKRVEEIPGWRIQPLASRPSIPLALCAAVGLVVLAFWTVSDPVPVVLVSRQVDGTPGVAGSHLLLPEMVFLAPAGQQLDLRLSAIEGDGLLQIHGPGSLRVRRASTRRFDQTRAFHFDLPQGAVSIWFGKEALPHGFRLTTPEALIRLTGTWVHVEATKGLTRVKVFNGSAEVRNRLTGRKEDVPAGSEASIFARSITSRAIQTSAAQPAGGIESAPLPSSLEGEEAKQDPTRVIFYEVE
ncbi:MAG: FecR family protein [Candidatus Omnitrophica bacterium]|nr:FecR family protein [Candidatus Omnitrophota bacterium]